MSTLVLLRHGQAAFGAQNYDQLSPLGHQQARAVGAHFRDRATRFDAVYVGPRERQRLTVAHALLEQTQPAPVLEPLLNEFAEGSDILRSAERRFGAPLLMNDSGVPHEQKLRLYGEEVRLWASGEGEIEGIESAQLFRQRIRQWLGQITANNRPGQRVLASTSAGVIGAIVAEVLQLPDSAMAPLMSVVANGSLTTVLWSRRGVVLESFNQVLHLPPDLLSTI